MARAFTEASARRLTKIGKHKDGLCVGLHLQVTRSSRGFARSWCYRYRSPITQRVRWMGLGPLDLVSLKEARQLATEARRKVRLDKVDPLDERHRKLAAARAEAAASMTFSECVRQYLDEQGDRLANRKHAAQLRSTLGRACDAFGSLDVAQIETPTLVKFLRPICEATPETGKRLQGRIERVLDWATVNQFRKGENPARWKGNLEHVLPRRKGVQKHFAAMPWSDLPALCAVLGRSRGLSVKALEFTILTAARSGETLGATWDEIDLENATWTIPAERMKAGKEHVVPLSDRAVELLKSIERRGPMPFPLSVNSMAQMLRAKGHEHTVHGMRSAFRDWAGETNAAERIVIEMSLAHQLKDKTEAAYYRSNELDRRRILLDKWSEFLSGVDSKVVRLKRA